MVTLAILEISTAYQYFYIHKYPFSFPLSHERFLLIISHSMYRIKSANHLGKVKMRNHDLVNRLGDSEEISKWLAEFDEHNDREE